MSSLQDKLIQVIRNEIGMILKCEGESKCKINKDVTFRLNQIETQLKAQAAGLQNVYDQFTKLTDARFIVDWNSEKNKLIKEMNDLRKTLYEIVDSNHKLQKKIYVIDSLYSLRNIDADTVTKLANIIKAMEE